MTATGDREGHCQVLKQQEKRVANSFNSSCEDKNSIEPQISRLSEAAMAAVWESLVCGVHDADYWELVEGRNS